MRYSILCTTVALCANAELKPYGRFHDARLIVGAAQTISFLLPMSYDSIRAETTMLQFDPDFIEIRGASVTTNSCQGYTIVSVTLLARDVGSTTFGFSTPGVRGVALAAYEPQFIKNNPIS